MPTHHYRIFEQIMPKWDMDFHVHTCWSQDNLQGPSMEDFAQLGERYQIHIGFADHFEPIFYKTQDLKYGHWRLNPDSIDQYLEEFDLIKTKYPHLSVGLEIDYMPEVEVEIQNFCDDYAKEFDFFLGSVHKIHDLRDLTTPRDLELLIADYSSLSELFDHYIQIQKQMIKTDLFDIIAHPNVIFRHIHPKSLSSALHHTIFHQMIELGKLIKDFQQIMEINLSGLLYTWDQSFPSQKVMKNLVLHEIPLVIGSDSHNLDHFHQQVVNIRKYNTINRNDWLFTNRI